MEKLALLKTAEVALIEDEKDLEAFDTLLLQKKNFFQKGTEVETAELIRVSLNIYSN